MSADRLLEVLRWQIELLAAALGTDGLTVARALVMELETEAAEPAPRPSTTPAAAADPTSAKGR